jgi:hypothetical protein
MANYDEIKELKDIEIDYKHAHSFIDEFNVPREEQGNDIHLVGRIMRLVDKLRNNCPITELPPPPR